jgi:membrane glycosyltransferase
MIFFELILPSILILLAPLLQIVMGITGIHKYIKTPYWLMAVYNFFLGLLLSLVATFVSANAFASAASAVPGPHNLPGVAIFFALGVVISVVVIPLILIFQLIIFSPGKKKKMIY